MHCQTEILDSTMAVQEWKDLLTCTGIYIHIELERNSLIRLSVVLGGGRKHLKKYFINSPVFSSIIIVTNSFPHNFTNVYVAR
jgi:hypothetical protein